MARLTARRTTAALLLAVTLGACSTTDGTGSTGSSTPGGNDFPASRAPATGAPAASSAPSSTSGAPDAAACPSSYAAPDANRPRVSLAFTVAADHSTVTGTEQVTFAPDKPITELVFRLTANTRPSVAQGNRIRITSATSSPSGEPFTFTQANAAPGTQGGLLRVPLGRTVAANTVVTAKLAFTLTLGADSFDRFGRSDDFAWFGSGQPLLAWQRGYGWHTEDLLNFTAESATSEAMDTELSVTAPSDDVVIASGNPADPPKGSGDTRTWTSSLAAARDVLVSVGPFAVKDVRVGRTALRVGAPDQDELTAQVEQFERAIEVLSKQFGPFPFPSLAVARVPAQGGGIEYPGSILMLDSSQLVAVHETAHEYFYAMVGNSQSQHPWLDEAFASYAQELVDGTPSHSGDLQSPGDVDSSTQSYGTDENGYYFTTYDKGSAALEAARTAAGGTAFDAAIRCYVNANAWRIAEPSDLEAALAKLPKAVRVLQQAGALP
ncbi:gluzincin family metallopeptidase [Jatrophihabitans fulvus]